jgi:outer membrane protein OmpA-like peptidoglycan-associated protein
MRLPLLLMALACAAPAAFAAQPIYGDRAGSDRAAYGPPSPVDETLSTEAVAVLLHERGYRSIMFVDRSPPIYVAYACREDTLFTLDVEETGEIRERRRLGACDLASDGRGGDVGRSLKDSPYGIGAIEQRDESLLRGDDCSGPRRGGGLEPCRQTDKASPIKDEIVALLTALKYTSIQVVGNHPRMQVEACHNARRYRLAFEAGGDLSAREAIGSCDRHAASYQDRPTKPAPYARPGQCRRDLEALVRSTRFEFDRGSATLREELKPTLLQIAQLAQDCDGLTIEVAGYTDAIGDRIKNLYLSQRRAEVVVDYLAQSGLERRRLTARGYGAEEHPAGGDLIVKEEPVHRRIEFVLSWANRP